MSCQEGLHVAVNVEKCEKFAPVLMCIPPPRLGSPEILPTLLGRRQQHDKKCDVSSQRAPSVRFGRDDKLPALVAPIEKKDKHNGQSIGALQIETSGSIDFVEKLAMIISDIHPSIQFLQVELEKANKQQILIPNPEQLEYPKPFTRSLPRLLRLKKTLKTKCKSQLRPKIEPPSGTSADLALNKANIKSFVDVLERTRERIDAEKWKNCENHQQLQLSANAAVQRFRAKLHSSPHRPFHLPAPMQMRPVTERRKKIQIKLPSASPATVDSSGSPPSPYRSQKRRGVIDMSRSDDALQSDHPLCLDPLRVIQLSSANLRRGTSVSSVSETEDDDASTQDGSSCASRCISPCMSRNLESPCPQEPQMPTPRLLLQVRKERENINNALEALDRKAEQSKAGRRATMATSASDLRRRLSSILEISEQTVDQRAAAIESSRRASFLQIPNGVNPFRRMSGCIPRRSSTCPAFDVGDDADNIGEDCAVVQEDEDPPENPCGLRLVRLHSSCDERLKRLRKLTTLHSLKCWCSRDELGIADMDKARFAAVFTRYDANRAGCLGLTDVHYALEDLGLRLPCRHAKEELFLTLQKYEGGTLDFRQFCEVIVRQRQSIVDNQRFTLKELFQKYDTAGSGILQPEELMELFKEFELCPARADERIAFCDAVLESDIDGSGGFDWNGFERLAQLLREKLAHCRYERELRIFYQSKLPFSFFINFRHRLTWLHETFVRHDTASCGYLQQKACDCMILELGFKDSQLTLSHMFATDKELQKLSSENGNITFATMLRILQRIRDLRNTAGQDLKDVFDRHDMCKTGFLKVSEVVRLLNKLEFDALPDKRPDVLRIVEEEDIDGDECLDCSDFVRVFHHLYELCLRCCREEEAIHAESLGFSRDELQQLREGFDMLVNKELLCLDLDGVICALKMLGESWASSDNLLDIVGGQQCKMDFRCFLNLCHAVNKLKEKPVNTRKVLVCEAVRKMFLRNDWRDSF